MNVFEIKDKKRQAELEITRILRELQEETGCDIYTAHLTQTFESMGSDEDKELVGFKFVIELQL